MVACGYQNSEAKSLLRTVRLNKRKNNVNIHMELPLRTSRSGGN